MKLNLNKALIFGMYAMVIVDLLTGALLLKNPGATLTPGLVYKLIMLTLLYYFLPKMTIWVFVANASIITSTIICTALSGFSGLTSNIVAITKLLMYVTFFFYLMYLLKESIITRVIIYKIAVFSYIVIVINQFLGLLGFGKPTYLLYGVPVGTSGFFFEHNATGIILVILISIIYIHLRNEVSLRKLILFLIFSVFIGFTFATKTATVGSLAVALIAIYERNKKILPVALGLLVIPVIIYWTEIQNVGQVAKIIDDINVNDTEGVFSGRTFRLVKSIDDYFNKFSFTEQLIGIGNYRIINDLTLGETAETDYIDILKMSGLVGFVIVYFSFFFVVFKEVKLFLKYRMREFAIVLVLNGLFLAISSTAGHLFTSGSVNFYLALLNAYPFFLLHEANNLQLKSIKSDSNLVD